MNGAYGVQNLKLYQKMEDFIEYFFPIIDRFPKYEKFALCSQIKNQSYDILKTIIETNKQKVKISGWYRVDMQLDFLRFLVRHSVMRKYLSMKSYETAGKKIDELGRLIGGLLKGP